MRTRIGIWACVAVCASCVLTGPSPALARSKRDAANLRAARFDVQRLLRRARLPAGAVEVTRNPAPALLSVMAFWPQSPNLVSRHRFYVIPGAPDTVLGWIEAHPPLGGQLSEKEASSSSPGMPQTTSGDGFDWPGVAGVLSNRLLAYIATAASHGGTALRLDAEDVWLLTRPSSERVPSDVSSIEATVRTAGTSPTTTRHTVTAASTIRRIVILINRLPIRQPGVLSCPVGRGPVVRLTFSGPAGAHLARAVASGGGCGDVALTIRGRHQPDLAGGVPLVRQVLRLLG